MKRIETFGSAAILEDYRGEDGTAKGPHLAKIGGVFNAEGATSRNRRTYVDVGRWVGEADTTLQTGTTLPMFTSHGAAERDTTLEKFGKLDHVYMQDHEARYEGLVANTTAGRDVLTLIEGGYVTAISQRLGQPFEIDTLKAESSPDGEAGWEVIRYGQLLGIDITDRPGIEHASIGVLESANGRVLVESFPITDPLYWERDFSADQRKQMAKDGVALPNGSYPIPDKGALRAAIVLAQSGHGDVSAAKAHILKRARALGATNMLPKGWNESTSPGSVGEPPSTDEGANDMTDIAETIRQAMTVAGVEAAPPDSAAVLQTAPRSPVSEGQALDEQKAARKEAKRAEKAAEQIAHEHESSDDDEPVTAEEVEEEEDTSSASVELDEAGRAISGANTNKLQAAHDALAAMPGVTCGTEPDGDESTVDEPAMQILVERTVKRALKKQEKAWRREIEERAGVLFEGYKAELLKARRKTKPITEEQADAARSATTEAEPDPEKVSLAEAIRAEMKRQGHNLYGK